MTTLKIYRNKWTDNKFIEVHNDGHYHNRVRQYMEWKYRKNGVLLSVAKNFTGDGVLHRWRVGNLKELLADYEEVSYENYANR